MKAILFWCLLLLPTAVWSQDFLGQFPYSKQALYFDFHYQRNSPRIEAIARFADGFVKLLSRDFFKADFDYPIRVLVLKDRAQFKGFLIETLHLDDPPNFGVYLFRHKMFVTYEDSGLGTFAHEILHPLVERNLSDRPGWAMEGIPTFFEKFYGYWKHDELVAHWGYQNPWRIAQIGTGLTRLDLRKIIADPEPTAASRLVERSESSWRLVSVFLWQQGKLKRFLALIAAKDRGGYPSYLEAAMQMPIEKVIPLWQDYLNDIAAHRTEILSLPGSTVCDDEAAFQTFTNAHGVSPEQPKGG